ncbi:hypothetical protein B0H19DRAFT_1065308 [Mycena capillaripes]|nr:hypothetical protein B0H19DRAFT_1065308 [Mycena capillaripes]
MKCCAIAQGTIHQTGLRRGASLRFGHSGDYSRFAEVRQLSDYVTLKWTGGSVQVWVRFRLGGGSEPNNGNTQSRPRFSSNLTHWLDGLMAARIVHGRVPFLLRYWSERRLQIADNGASQVGNELSGNRDSKYRRRGSYTVCNAGDRNYIEDGTAERRPPASSPRPRSPDAFAAFQLASAHVRFLRSAGDERLLIANWTFKRKSDYKRK